MHKRRKKPRSANKANAGRGLSNSKSKRAHVESGDEQDTGYSPVVVILWGILFFVSPLFIFDFAEGFLGGFAWFVVIIYVALLLRIFVLRFGTTGVGGRSRRNSSPGSSGGGYGDDGGDGGDGGGGDGGGGGGGD